MHWHKTPSSTVSFKVVKQAGATLQSLYFCSAFFENILNCIPFMAVPYDKIARLA
jgi:hypothetical protein